MMRSSSLEPSRELGSPSEMRVAQMRLACRNRWKPACRSCPRFSRELFQDKGKVVVPGGGIEPPRAEARRILSPLRLPVPPSRLYLQVPDFTTCLWLCSLFIENDECATV